MGKTESICRVVPRSGDGCSRRKKPTAKWLMTRSFKGLLPFNQVKVNEEPKISCDQENPGLRPAVKTFMHSLN
jgi:hypothetical protein